jgi:hypothetical protein
MLHGGAGGAFIVDKEVLKSGLIIFRRGDMAHRMTPIFGFASSKTSLC